MRVFRIGTLLNGHAIELRAVTAMAGNNKASAETSHRSKKLQTLALTLNFHSESETKHPIILQIA
jgi:hypothetical protein